MSGLHFRSTYSNDKTFNDSFNISSYEYQPHQEINTSSQPQDDDKSTTINLIPLAPTDNEANLLEAIANTIINAVKNVASYINDNKLKVVGKTLQYSLPVTIAVVTKYTDSTIADARTGAVQFAI